MEPGAGRGGGFLSDRRLAAEPVQGQALSRGGNQPVRWIMAGAHGRAVGSARDAGMRVICSQNEVALAHLDDPTIVGWMHGDEPDNAQSLGSGQGYGPPVAAREDRRTEYERIRKADPSRPVLLNLGQGVAWDGWYGRGVRTNHPEDYPEYIQGCDIASFDIYPVTHDNPEVAGNLWYVARGVERLVGWADGRKTVWNCIECTRIRQRRPQAHAGAGAVRSVDVDHPRVHRADLLRARVEAEVRRIGAAERCGDVRGGGPDQSPDRGVGAGAEQPDGPGRGEGSAGECGRADRDDGQEAGRGGVSLRRGDASGPDARAARDPGAVGPAHGRGPRREPHAGGADGVFEDDFKPWDVHLYRLAAAN